MLIGVKDSQSDLEKHYKTFCGLYIPLRDIYASLDLDLRTFPVYCNTHTDWCFSIFK